MHWQTRTLILMENGFLINMLEIVRYFMETSFFFCFLSWSLLFLLWGGNRFVVPPGEGDRQEKEDTDLSLFFFFFFLLFPVSLRCLCCYSPYCIFLLYSKGIHETFQFRAVFVKQFSFSPFLATRFTQSFFQKMNQLSLHLLPMSVLGWNNTSHSSWVRISPFTSFFRQS